MKDPAEAVLQSDVSLDKSKYLQHNRAHKALAQLDLSLDGSM